MDAATKRAMHGSCARVRRRRQNFRPALAIRHEPAIILLLGLVAQLVEQRIENPCVGGSIPPRATKNIPHETPTHAGWRFCFWDSQSSCPVYCRSQSQMSRWTAVNLLRLLATPHHGEQATVTGVLQ